MESLLDDRSGSSDRVIAVALAGKVYCKVRSMHSMCRVVVGDLLTTSPTPGHAMKATEAACAFRSVGGNAL
jgi:hypothetical protein